MIRAFWWLAFLGPFFFLSYGFTNWVTSLREPVASFAFPWEHHIPFLAWTIIPYWTSSLLYAISFFLPATKEELDQHGLRLLTALLVSLAAFLLFPLKLTFTAPVVTGNLGWLFAQLHGLDLPYNLAPSLQISLAVILAARYRSPWVTAWLTLAALSTLTTYQHHLIDLPAGPPPSAPPATNSPCSILPGPPSSPSPAGGRGGPPVPGSWSPPSTPSAIPCSSAKAAESPSGCSSPIAGSPK